MTRIRSGPMLQPGQQPPNGCPSMVFPQGLAAGALQCKRCVPTSASLNFMRHLLLLDKPQKAPSLFLAQRLPMSGCMDATSQEPAQTFTSHTGPAAPCHLLHHVPGFLLAGPCSCQCGAAVSRRGCLQRARVGSNFSFIEWQPLFISRPQSPSVPRALFILVPRAAL